MPTARNEAEAVGWAMDAYELHTNSNHNCEQWCASEEDHNRREEFLKDWIVYGCQLLGDRIPEELESRRQRLGL